MAMRNRGRRAYTRKNLAGRRILTTKGKRVRRAVLNNQPTFVETFQLARDNMFVQVNSGLGKYFCVKIQDVPQVASYSNLYTQYRINWVKVMLIPVYNTAGADPNAANYNQANAVASIGMARIVYSVQDSPGQTAPASEQEVLEDNGCKIKPMGTKWSCSFKPVPDISQAVGGSSTTIIPVKTPRKQWFNFDTATPANNPLYGGVKAYITLPGTASDTAGVSWICYYKVSFTLRDPQ